MIICDIIYRQIESRKNKVIRMGFEVLLNDYYDLLKLMYDNEAIVLDKKIIPLTQLEIAKSLNYSKMKVNSMFGVLQKEKFIEQQMRGKYVLTDKAYIILKTIESINAKIR